MYCIYYNKLHNIINDDLPLIITVQKNVGYIQTNILADVQISYYHHYSFNILTFICEKLC